MAPRKDTPSTNAQARFDDALRRALSTPPVHKKDGQKAPPKVKK
jgi:hypothetical protein